MSDGDVVVLSAYRQGYSWIEEVVLPRLLGLREEGTPTARVRLLFREHRPPPDWPQQAMHTPLRWQHAMFPADEIMAEALALDLGDVGFELRTEQDAPAYQIVAEGADGEVLLNETFEPRVVSRPFFDRYPDYELIQVTTGQITAEVDGETVVDERSAWTPRRSGTTTSRTPWPASTTPSWSSTRGNRGGPWTRRTSAS